MALKIYQMVVWAVMIQVALFYGINLLLTRRENRLPADILEGVTLCTSFYICWTGLNKTPAAFITMVLLILYVIIAFKEKIWYKALAMFSAMMVAAFVEMGLNFFYYRIVTKDIWIGNNISVQNSIYVTVCCILQLLAYIALSKVYALRRTRDLHLDRNAVFFFLVPISQYLLFACYTVQGQRYQGMFYKMVNRPMMYAGILIAVVADILIFRALIDYSTARHNKLRLAELEYEQKLSQNYYDSIRKNAEQLMKYKHDFNNIVSTAYSLLSSADPEQRERGMQILGELYQKNLKNPIIPHYCANSTINAVIFDKMNAADERGVELVTDINIPENMKVELTDLCSVFANLIDNAFASAEKSKNKRVELSAHTDVGCLFVLAKNYPDEMPQMPAKKSHFKNGKFSEHGYGLDIIRGVAEKYDGSLEMRTENGCVEILAVLKIA